MTASGAIVPPTPVETPLPDTEDLSPVSVLTPSRFIPSLLSFTPLIRIPPLPERPRLNIRSLNPFSRPLSPIASSPSASPEVFPKHRNGGGVTPDNMPLPHLQFPEDGNPSLLSELPPDSEMSSCTTFLTDLGNDSLTPAAVESSAFSASPSPAPFTPSPAPFNQSTFATPSSADSYLDCTLSGNADDSLPASSAHIVSAGNVLFKSSPSVSQDATSKLNWSLGDPSSADVPLINLTMNPLPSNAAGESPHAKNILLGGVAFNNNSALGSESESVFSDINSSQHKSPSLRNRDTRNVPPNTLQIPAGRG